MAEYKASYTRGEISSATISVGGLGLSGAGLGDINGDGYGDILLGAPASGTSGTAYVILGVAGGLQADINTSTLNGSNGFRISGAALGDAAGISVSDAGDVNGDGYADILVGATGTDQAGANSGAAYVVFGKATPFSANVSLSSLNGLNGFKISGEQGGSATGFSVSTAGDVNGDGYADLLVAANNLDTNIVTPGGSHGTTYVVFGKKSGFISNLDVATLNGTNGFQLWGASINGAMGQSVSDAGDMNGDGFRDMLVGTNGAGAYVVYGRKSGFTANVNVSTLTGSNGFKITGEQAGDGAGTKVSAAGDVNGDGYADVIVSAPASNAGGNASGAAYVVFGKAAAFTPTLALSSLNGSNGFQITGSTGDETGAQIADAGDMNGDGLADVMVSAKNGSTSNVHIVFGSASGTLANVNLASLNGSTGFTVMGIASADVSLSRLGDLNGDGLTDILLGSQDSGEAHIIYGRLPDAAVTRTGTDASQVLVGGSFDDTLSGGNGNDRLYGNDGHDRLYGNSGNDRLYGGNGDDTLNGGAGADVYYGGAGADLLSFYSGAGVKVALDKSIAATGDAIGDTFSSVENVAGSNTGADTIVGNSSNNRLSGYGGNDVLSGKAGSDILKGGIGNDTLDGGTGRDSADYSDMTASVSVTLNGATAASVRVGASIQDTVKNIESLVGGSAADSLRGDTIANTLYGSGGTDDLFGMGGDDNLRGGAGVDDLDGGTGLDTADFADLFDSVVLTLRGAVKSTSTIDGISGDTAVNIENVAGGSADDILSGDALNNRLSGNAGVDRLNGLSGNDTLTGGLGADILTGGLGSDTFHYASQSHGGDDVFGFAAEDTLSFLGSAFGGLGSGPLAASQFRSVTSGHDAAGTGAQFVFNTFDDELWFDADGTGSTQAVQICDFIGGANLTIADFLMV